MSLKLNPHRMLLAAAGSRISHLLPDSVSDHACFTPLGFAIHTTTIAALASPWPPPYGYRATANVRRRNLSSSSAVHSKSSSAIVPGCFSQQEDGRQLPSEELSSVAGGVVALGKFDALHIGHRELAIQASKVGVPFLLSFVGMAEVLGWEPRAPIVAKCDRKRVLNSWAPYCGNVPPKEFEVNFSSVRHLSPRLFVEKLSKELGVSGVVAGENYRFGYKAAGNAQELMSLCKEYGVTAYIINSVMDKKQDFRDITSIQRDMKERGQVSSTRVRHALAVGDMKYVSELLGRRHRLILTVKDLQGFSVMSSKVKASAPRSWLLNLPPKEGLYEDCAIFWGAEEEEVVTCRVVIQTTHVHLEIDEGEAICKFLNSSEELPILGIEFGRLEVDCG